MPITLILAAINAFLDMTPRVVAMIQHLNQSDEMTSDAKAALRKRIADSGLDPAWMPDITATGG